MKSMISKVRNAPLTAMTAMMASFYAGQASAQSDEGTIGAIFDGGVDQAESAGTFALAAAFATGVFFVFMGGLKLKAAADTQGQQVKYGEGIWRLGVGALLVAIPSVIAITQTSVGIDGNADMSFSSGFSGG